MIFHPQKIPDVFIIEPEPFADDRGMFRRNFCKKEFEEAGIISDICQSNISENKFRHTLRGLHYQLPPSEEGKTMTCIRGAMHDIVVDLRSASPTYLQWIPVELNEDNRLSIHIPPGCANAFLTLADNTVIYYLSSQFYSPSDERGVRWNDPLFKFEWPAAPAVITEKDNSHPDFIPEKSQPGSY